MKPISNYSVVWVTAPNRRTARRLATAALEARLAACVSLVPGVESHYWWEGRREKASEVWLCFKTMRSRLVALERVILSLHPYDTPEFLVLPLTGGNPRYLDWINQSVG